MGESNGQHEHTGGQGVAVLSDPHHERGDLKLVGRAVRERWPVVKREEIVERLLKVVEKESVVVMTKDGPESVDGPADANAISAARVLVQMESQNQADEHKVIDKTIPTPTEPPLTEAQREAHRRAIARQVMAAGALSVSSNGIVKQFHDSSRNGSHE